MMDIRQLKYFLMVAEEGQITRAAARLHMAQPPLTQQLQQMEKELGTALFHKKGGKRKLELTQAGQMLLERAKTITHLMDVATLEIQELNAGLRGTLSVGTIPSWGGKMLPKWLRMLHEKYPEVQFKIYAGSIQKTLELVHEGKIEIGLIRLPVNEELFCVHPLPSDSLIVAAHHEWRSHFPGDVVTISQLEYTPLILLREEVVNFEIYNSFIASCHQAGFEPNILCESSDMFMLLKMAEAGLGITVVPSSAQSMLNSSDLFYKPLIGSEFQLTAALIWKRDHYLSAAARNFLTIARSHTTM
jgi:DNA-binding transcriptional LysR family regulator